MAKEPRIPIDPFEQPSPVGRLWRRLFGAPRDVQDPSIFHKISLMAFLAWIGLGADGLSSSAYGPAEAFKNLLVRNPSTGALEGQWYLAIFLALSTVITVFVISYADSSGIEQFPHGGGGYVVATKLLGPRAGVVSGCALLVDYVLTITVSVAAGGDAIFDLLPHALRANFDLKIVCELAVLAALLIMNLRGVKESVEAVMPVFLVFVVTHLVLIVLGIGSHLGRVPEVVGQVSDGLGAGWRTFGSWGLLGIFVKLTIASEAALLFVAAQTGFIDGPRVMSNMAVDSWLPHRFASLSDRLTTKDGVLLMGWSAMALLLLTHGSVDVLVVMYSDNVFATFSLTQMGMCRFWFGGRREHENWVRHISVHVLGLVLCLTILSVMVVEKF